MDKFDELQSKAIESALAILGACGLQMTYDPSVKALYVHFREWNTCYRRDIVARTEEVNPSIMVDFDHEDKVLGVEILLPG